MRTLLFFTLMALTSPALAQVAPYPTAPYGYAPPPYQAPVVPPQLLDPAMPAQLGRMASALTEAFMNLPVGELEAAVEGRPATLSDRRKTVGSVARRHHPDIEHDIQRQVASSAGAVQSGAQAMQRAMPVIGNAIGQAAAEIDRATANLPSPFYPVR
ncbi:MAG: hypothetical protein NVS3B5_05140 [Sphingomicrobium sp.]